MSYLFWIIFGAIGSAAVWWIIDWEDKNPDGD
jgi:hypothetical protein